MNRIIVVGLVAASAACTTDPTQIVVTADSTLCGVDRIAVLATGVSGVPQSAELVVTDLDADLPFEVDISGDGQVQVDVIAYNGEVELGRRSGTLAFSEGELLGVHAVIDEACRRQTCTLESAAAFSSAPAGVTRDCDCPAEDPECVFVERYDVAPTTLISHIDACDAVVAVRGVVLADLDEAEAKLPLDAELENGDFRFYGQLVRHVWVNTNGVVTFSEEAPGGTNIDGVSPGALDGIVPGPSIMGFWDDLETRANGVCYAIRGQAPVRTLTISWSNVCFKGCDPADDLNFSVELEEGTDRVKITYGDMIGASADRAGGLFATVGVIGLPSGASVGCTPDACSTDGLCSDQSACGYTQAFSQLLQSSGVPFFIFDPIEE